MLFLFMVKNPKTCARIKLSLHITQTVSPSRNLFSLLYPCSLSHSSLFLYTLSNTRPDSYNNSSASSPQPLPQLSPLLLAFWFIPLDNSRTSRCTWAPHFRLATVGFGLRRVAVVSVLVEWVGGGERRGWRGEVVRWLTPREKHSGEILGFGFWNFGFFCMVMEKSNFKNIWGKPWMKMIVGPSPISATCMLILFMVWFLEREGEKNGVKWKSWGCSNRSCWKAIVSGLTLMDLWRTDNEVWGLRMRGGKREDKIVGVAEVIQSLWELRENLYKNEIAFPREQRFKINKSFIVLWI